VGNALGLLAARESGAIRAASMRAWIMMFRGDINTSKTSKTTVPLGKMHIHAQSYEEVAGEYSQF
jgi:hypothetical protein